VGLFSNPIVKLKKCFVLTKVKMKHLERPANKKPQ